MTQPHVRLVTHLVTGPEHLASLPVSLSSLHPLHACHLLLATCSAACSVANSPVSQSCTPTRAHRTAHTPILHMATHEPMDLKCEQDGHKRHRRT